MLAPKQPTLQLQTSHHMIGKTCVQSIEGFVIQGSLSSFFSSPTEALQKALNACKGGKPPQEPQNGHKQKPYLNRPRSTAGRGQGSTPQSGRPFQRAPGRGGDPRQEGVREGSWPEGSSGQLPEARGLYASS